MLRSRKRAAESSIELSPKSSMLNPRMAVGLGPGPRSAQALACPQQVYVVFSPCDNESLNRCDPRACHGEASPASAERGKAKDFGVSLLRTLALAPESCVHQVRFRRPAYRSIQEDLEKYKAAELMSGPGRVMVTYAGDRAPESRGTPGVRFGELRRIEEGRSIADRPFGSRPGGAGGGAGGDAVGAVGDAEEPPEPLSVVEYWRGKGFDYSADAARRVVCVDVQLDGGGSTCTYPGMGSTS